MIPSTDIDVSIVIVNYNVKDLLLKCIHSLVTYVSPSLALEIMVVDNASSDGSIPQVKQQFPEVICIENNTNIGFPKANNQAFAMAKGKYILMLNPDTELFDNSLVSMVHYLAAHPEITAIAPGLLNTDGSHQKSVWRFPYLSSVVFEMFYVKSLVKHKHYEDMDFTKPFVADSVSGAAILFRTELLAEIGMLNERMFWIEDVDFCYRIHQNGGKLMYFPAAKMLHHIGQSAKKNYNISISNQVFNKIKYFREHHPGGPAVGVTFFSFLHVLMKLFLFGLLSPLHVMYRRKARAYAYTLPKVFFPPDGIA
jgi:GT2 family glycosyltransferase